MLAVLAHEFLRKGRMFTNFFIIFVGVRPFCENSWERVSDRSDRSDESEKGDEKQVVFVNRILSFSFLWLAQNRAREVVVEKNAAEKRPYNKAVSSHPYCVSSRPYCIHASLNIAVPPLRFSEREGEVTTWRKS